MTIRQIFLVAAATAAMSGAQAQSVTGDLVPVTADNFARAESDLYLGNIARDSGSANSIIAANPHRSIIRPSSVSTATRSIPARYSISIRGQ
jgi:hypothetical protein